MKIKLPIIEAMEPDMEEIERNQNLGIDTGVIEVETFQSEAIFYRIDCLIPADGITEVVCCGTSYICPLPIEEVERMIDEQMLPKGCSKFDIKTADYFIDKKRN